MPEFTDEQVERMARMFHARSKEGRDGFQWPVNGDWGRKRDMDNARRALEYVFREPAGPAASDVSALAARGLGTGGYRIVPQVPEPGDPS